MDAAEGTFYFRHREKILKSRKSTYICEFCGRTNTFGNKSRHQKTLHCIISKINNSNDSNNKLNDSIIN